MPVVAEGPAVVEGIAIRLHFCDIGRVRGRTRRLVHDVARCIHVDEKGPGEWAALVVGHGFVCGGGGGTGYDRPGAKRVLEGVLKSQCFRIFHVSSHRKAFSRVSA